MELAKPVEEKEVNQTETFPELEAIKEQVEALKSDPDLSSKSKIFELHELNSAVSELGDKIKRQPMDRAKFQQIFDLVIENEEMNNETIKELLLYPLNSYLNKLLNQKKAGIYPEIDTTAYTHGPNMMNPAEARNLFNQGELAKQKEQLVQWFNELNQSTYLLSHNKHTFTSALELLRKIAQFTGKKSLEKRCREIELRVNEKSKFPSELVTLQAMSVMRVKKYLKDLNYILKEAGKDEGDLRFLKENAINHASEESSVTINEYAESKSEDINKLKQELEKNLLDVVDTALTHYRKRMGDEAIDEALKELPPFAQR